MPDDEHAVPESPSTWENVVMGEVKEIIGHAVGNHELAEQGEEQVEIAHEVREEFDEEHKD